MVKNDKLFRGVVKSEHEVYVASLPDCDLCKFTTGNKPVPKAQYDARLKHGSWAYVCDFHFKLNECHTGVGTGQRLLVRKGGES